MTKRSNWSIPYFIFLILFVILPLVLVVVYAFQSNEGGFTLSNIGKFFSDSDAISTFALSLEVAIENTLICILLGYPAAYILADKQLNRSAVTIVLFILPMWINALMRTLATTELFNMLGFTLGKGTLLFGMAYDYLPFMIYPIYNILQKMDKSYGEAAEEVAVQLRRESGPVAERLGFREREDHDEGDRCIQHQEQQPEVGFRNDFLRIHHISPPLVSSACSRPCSSVVRPMIRSMTSESAAP